MILLHCNPDQQFCTAILHLWYYCTADSAICTAFMILHCWLSKSALHLWYCTADSANLHCIYDTTALLTQPICTAFMILLHSWLSLHCTAYSACEHRTKKIQLVWFQGLSDLSHTITYINYFNYHQTSWDIDKIGRWSVNAICPWSHFITSQMQQ